jgi:hypothetical protein
MKRLAIFQQRRRPSQTVHCALKEGRPVYWFRIVLSLRGWPEDKTALQQVTGLVILHLNVFSDVTKKTLY